ncbi:MAG: APC family permease [Oscillospiraceae bacterium]|nr:APC family permease [Oscillospiraceae bacterium]
MENKLERKYGLFTAICMVVGIVIGSGVFFKAQAILQKTGGDLPLGILAWVIGGIIMLCNILAFSYMAQKYEKVNGIVDYAEAMCGAKYAYYMGWFITTVYYPAMTGVLCWVSARYTLVFLTSAWPNFPLLIPADQGGCIVGPECMAVTLFYMVLMYTVNALAPKAAGKLQTSTTVIKFIPLTLMAVVGILVGLLSPTKMLVNNFAAASQAVLPEGTSTAQALLGAVCATAFAYEGWIIATSINAELKDSKKNLPRALIIGGLVIMATYIAYYVGVAGGATVDELMNVGATVAFTNIFGGFFGNILNLFIVISCLGTTNGLMLGQLRGMYALAARGKGPNPEVMAEVDDKTNMPNNAAVLGLMVCAFWGVYFYFANLFGTMGGLVCFAGTPFESAAFVFDSSELPILTIYAMYTPIFVQWMRKATDEGVLRRFIIPGLATVGCLFMVYASIVGHRMGNFWYLIVFGIFMLAGARFSKSKNA